MEEGTILAWRKKDGEEVRKGEVLAEIETDKATVEIDAEADGILRIIVQEGTLARVGTVIAAIEVGSEALPSATGQGVVTSKANRKDLAQAKTYDAEPLDRSEPVAHDPGQSTGAGDTVGASPLARALARELGVSLRSLTGTGPGGRIVEHDVRVAAQGHKMIDVPQGAVAHDRGVHERGQPNGMQMTIARRMGQSKATIPHFYVTVEVRMDDALNLQRQLRATVRGAEGVNVTDMVVRASAMALRSFPRMNSSWAGGNVEVQQAINIGLAVDIPNGLVVPVIQDAGNKHLLEIANERQQLVARAKEGIMSESAASGGTFTVSNLGMFGVDEFAAIINPPEAAILAVGMLKEAAVVDRGQLAIGRVMRMTLSADHRVCNGTDAAQFLGRLRTLLERPTAMVELDVVPSIDIEERGSLS